MTLFRGPDLQIASASVTRYSERSSVIDYVGTWRPARHSGYSGRGVRYATSGGATATITFTGSRIAWYGPVGPDTGQGPCFDRRRGGQDGGPPTLDVRSADRALSATWKASGRHTFTIEVLETKGHRLVAIDELVVTE